MSTPPHKHRSHLFLVRVWSEEKGEPAGEGQISEWQGKVQHILDGKAHHFSSLQALADMLPALLQAQENRQATLELDGAEAAAQLTLEDSYAEPLEP